MTYEANIQRSIWARAVGACGLAACLVAGGTALAADPGVTDTTIRIGGVMDLEGLSRGLGQGMRIGIEAALRGELVQGRSIEFVALNDFYDPPTTVQATRQLLDQGIFLMIGNVGTPTAAASLPVLAENRTPAVGFFTGAGLLRPGVGDVVNYRASYVQETASVINAALDSGLLTTSEICAFVQNDSYGMAGITGIRRALATRPGTDAIVATLDQILAKDGDEPQRNNIGPVGVYTRNTLSARQGYDSLKAWEQKNGTRCRLVVTVGAYPAIANFAGYARYKGDAWLVSAVSFTGADDLKRALSEFHVTDGVVVTQVVPPLDSTLPIVRSARLALGDDFGYVSLEGYIVGEMFLSIMRSIEGDITRANFLQAAYGRSFDLGGLSIDFSDDNQGSDLVQITYLNDGDYVPISARDLPRFIQR